jgi:hypothetical protein
MKFSTEKENKMYYSTDLFLKRKRNKYGPLLEKFRSKHSENSGNLLSGILSQAHTV